MTALFSTTFFGPIEYYAKLNQYPNALLEIHEHFPKQTYRNRTNIYDANGILTISIPLKSRNRERTAVKDICISYDSNWQQLLWRSITSAYRSSAFFEYYEAELEKLIFVKPQFLLEYNEMLHQWVCAKLAITSKFTYTKAYEKNYEGLFDFRNSIHPKIPSTFIHSKYMQVFASKKGFIPNLSIIDLLFNEGPHGTTVLDFTPTPNNQ